VKTFNVEVKVLDEVHPLFYSHATTIRETRNSNQPFPRDPIRKENSNFVQLCFFTINVNIMQITWKEKEARNLKNFACTFDSVERAKIVKFGAGLQTFKSLTRASWRSWQRHRRCSSRRCWVGCSGGRGGNGSIHLGARTRIRQGNRTILRRTQSLAWSYAMVINTRSQMVTNAIVLEGDKCQNFTTDYHTRRTGDEW